MIPADIETTTQYRCVWSDPGTGAERTRTGNERQVRAMVKMYAELGSELQHRVITVGDWTEGEPPEDDDDGD